MTGALFFGTMQIKLQSEYQSSGGRTVPAEIARNGVLTREPDTDDTGVGKDGEIS